jgi:expansin (peptidoglycan-binding protein)
VKRCVSIGTLSLAAMLLACCAACGASVDSGGPGSSGGGTTYGQVYAGGQFQLGPVDWAETAFHNACAPSTGYVPAIQQVEGTLLAGLWSGLPGVEADCDACIAVTTSLGKTAVLRVVTYGATTTNSIDVSPAAYAVLDSGEYPRAMTWQLAKCSDTGAILYEFKAGSSQWWTSLWVRNARVPIATVEVKSANHAAFTALTRGSDGGLVDAAGFGSGIFTLRVTGIDGQQVTDSYVWPVADLAGLLLVGGGNFQ